MTSERSKRRDFLSLIFIAKSISKKLLINIEKGTTITASRRIGKCPTPGRRFSDKFPTDGADKTLGGRHAWN